MKKLFLLALCALVFVPGFVLAQATPPSEFVPLAPIPGLTDSAAVRESADLADFFNSLYRILIGLAAIIAVVEIMIGGFQIATNDSVSKKSDGKERIKQALLGLVLVLLPVFVFSLINPSILNLDIVWQPLGLTPGAKGLLGGGGRNMIAPPPAPPSGCTTGSSGPFFEIASCASQSAAGSYSCKNGLSPVASTCRSKNQNGQCLDTNVTVHCGKTEYVIHYAYTHLLGAYGVGVPYVDINGQVIPRDASKQQSFASSCTQDGGSMVAETTTAGWTFVRSYINDPLAGVKNKFNGCPSDAEIVVDSTRASGVVCYSEYLACRPG